MGEMPKTASLQIKEKKISGKTVYWMTIPATLSPTGKRTRPQFDRKKKAELERERILAMNRRFGSEAIKIPAEVAADASRAMEHLRGHDITLTQLAIEYSVRMEKQAASTSLSNVWKEYQEYHEKKTIRGRPVSERSKKNTARTMGIVTAKMGKTLICEITADKMLRMLSESFKTAHTFNSARAHVASVCSFAVGKGYLTENPFDSVVLKKRDVADCAITVATPAQVKAAIEACRDYRKDDSVHENLRVDARDALAAVAIMAFAGVRPDGELGGLDWEQIDFDDGHIYITGKSAKSRNARRIPMQDNLLAWLSGIPKTERKGPVRPANWKRKWQVIRKNAGFADDSDILRHSFASYYHKAYSDAAALREALGHATKDVLFNNYLNLHTKQKDAVIYWSIRPGGDDVQLLEVS